VISNVIASLSKLGIHANAEKKDHSRGTRESAPVATAKTTSKSSSRSKRARAAAKRVAPDPARSG
jgi:hypothetical protein